MTYQQNIVELIEKHFNQEDSLFEKEVEKIAVLALSNKDEFLYEKINELMLKKNISL